VFGVIVGTGVGGGVVVDGRLLAGKNGIAGEWGHVPLPWIGDDECPGPACSCGKYGCIETFLSGPGLAADHLRHTGARLAAEQIAASAAVGDRACARTVDRYVDRMARALASVINLLDPEVIVVGGGLSAMAQIYQGVPRRLGRYVLCDGPVLTQLAPARHGDAGGVRGAACLWPVLARPVAALHAP
jgi:fructokinase